MGSLVVVEQESAGEQEKAGDAPDRNSARTPDQLFKQLHSEYRFTVDAAASDGNEKCPTYWTATEDALLQTWTKERVWCNPPYRKPGQAIERWITHAIADDPKVAVFLLPNSTGAAWFKMAHDHGEVHFVQGRVQFLPPVGVTYKGGNDRDSVIIVLGREAKKGRVVFRDARSGKILQ